LGNPWGDDGGHRGALVVGRNPLMIGKNILFAEYIRVAPLGVGYVILQHE
jgi:hypothetical protein